MRRLAAALLIWLLSTSAWAGQLQPPPPLAGPLCGGGNSVLGYPIPGSSLTCGTALATGSIANGAVGQVGVYGGLNAMTPLANVANSVLGITGAGNPVFSATLPTGLTIPGYAVLLSPVFTGDPRAPTPATADNDTSIATTAYVQAQGYMSGTAMVAGQIPIAASASSLSGSVPFGLTGSSTLVRTNVGGTIDSSLIGDASISGTKLAPGAVSASLGYTPASAAVTITPAPPLSGGGDLTASRSIGLTGPSNLVTFSANTIPKGAGISAFAASSIADGGSGVTIGVPTGGPQGPGTINVQAGIFSGGVPVGSGGGSANISGMTAGQLGVAGNPTSLTSSVPFGQTGTNTVLQTGAGGTIAPSVIPSTTVTPGSCTNCNLTITADGRITVQGNGTGGGVSTLTGDVTAGPGTGSIPATVTGVQGRAVSPAVAVRSGRHGMEPGDTALGTRPYPARGDQPTDRRRHGGARRPGARN